MRSCSRHHCHGTSRCCCIWACCIWAACWPPPDAATHTPARPPQPAHTKLATTDILQLLRRCWTAAHRRSSGPCRPARSWRRCWPSTSPTSAPGRPRQGCCAAPGPGWRLEAWSSSTAPSRCAASAVGRHGHRLPIPACCLPRQLAATRVPPCRWAGTTQARATRRLTPPCGSRTPPGQWFRGTASALLWACSLHAPGSWQCEGWCSGQVLCTRGGCLACFSPARLPPGCYAGATAT